MQLVKCLRERGERGGRKYHVVYSHGWDANGPTSGRDLGTDLGLAEAEAVALAAARTAAREGWEPGEVVVTDRAGTPVDPRRERVLQALLPENG